MNMKRICFECGSKEEVELRETIRKYEGDGYSFEMKVKEPFCKTCNAPIAIEEIEDDIVKMANERIREARGIIKKEEIIFILERYNVSQKFLSRLLGWGEITLTRYITGGYTPSPINSARLKDLNNPYAVQKLLNERAEETNGKISEETAFQKVQKNVNHEIDAIEYEDGKIYQVVNWFLSQTSDESSLTHLGLQKLLYFSQGWSKVLLGRWMFQDDCEAWVHGAVYPNVYDKFKKFKYLPLPKIKKSMNLSEEEIKVLESIKRYYFEMYSARTLETICHREKPYIMTRNGYMEDAFCSEIISKEYIDEYYHTISKQYHIANGNVVGIKQYLNQILE